ncbi:unnamed protein product [Microthlaspi erraticum]|uniref:Knottin scorpion toxin-like domain-containing protein n=1 Tax=Microthlaspi erraticum TaxID=1685480 RepID=A0A6D2I715_9BRAS|nr:unnamed protein product [Microthlaspi erraticum]
MWLAGNRLYPKPLTSGEQVAHSIIQAGLLLERGPLYKTCSAKRDIDNCDYCDRRCKDYGGDNFWGKCSLFWPIRECYCYWECP